MQLSCIFAIGNSQSADNAIRPRQKCLGRFCVATPRMWCEPAHKCAQADTDVREPRLYTIRDIRMYTPTVRLYTYYS